ncbi:MAG TPA: hypothetical protein VNE39_21745 [Planctomycetota bacterium]|nr:hypothetical protein [Planctomycetota bacterium]
MAQHATRRFNWARLPLIALSLIGLGLSGTARARPAMGNAVETEAFKPRDSWPRATPPDPRAEFLLPVNVVRIYSDEHSAEQMAPKAWVIGQIELANRTFRFSEQDMARFGPGRPAPCLQFQFHSLYDVHESEVSQIIGRPFDTENCYGATRDRNGVVRTGTADLRHLRVTENMRNLTIFCVWDIKDPDHETGGTIGAESNIGFALRLDTGPRRVLTRVSRSEPSLGIVVSRQANTYMNTVAHELGHYFSLPHAWEQQKNRALGITDLGTGPQGAVDAAPEWANVMDYDFGEGAKFYFSQTQLRAMREFTVKRARSVIVVQAASGGEVAQPPTTGKPVARIHRVWLDTPSPGGEVVAHVHFEVDDLRGKECWANVWFGNASGQKVQDTDGKYTTEDGQVAVNCAFQPPYDNTTYSDLRIVLPAGQLHLPPGQHHLQVSVGFYYAGESLAGSDPVAFDYVVPGTPPGQPGGGEAAGWVTGASVDPSVIHENAQWVRIRADLLLDGLQGQEVSLQALFQFPGTGTLLRDFDKRFYSTDGLVCSEAKTIPPHPRTKVSGLEIWIPVSQLHLTQESLAAPLVALLTVVHRGRALASVTTTPFTVQAGPPAAAGPSAEVKAIWFTHNVVERGQRGMMINVQFVVSGCVGRDVTVATWFWREGVPLKDRDGQFAAEDGQVGTSVVGRPMYPVTVYNDCRLFMPYGQLHMARGAHNIQVTAGIFCDKLLTQPHKPVPFQYTQP